MRGARGALEKDSCAAETHLGARAGACPHTVQRAPVQGAPLSRSLALRARPHGLLPWPTRARPPPTTPPTRRDGAARARRWDLVENYLWRSVNRLQMQATPAMLFLMIKAASLDGQFQLAESLLQVRARGPGGCQRRARARAPWARPGLRPRSLPASHPSLLPPSPLPQACADQKMPVDGHFYHAVISAALAAGEWEAFVRLFNTARNKGFPTPHALWSTIFRRLHAAGRKETCHYVWVALARGHNARLPRALYTQIIATFAEQGNLDDMQMARDAMRRRGAVAPPAAGPLGGAPDRRAHAASTAPEPAALAAMARAYEAAGPAWAPQLAAVQAEMAEAEAREEVE